MGVTSIEELVHGCEVTGSDRRDGVAVDLGGDGDGAVSEGVGDLFEGDSGFGHEAGRGMA